MIDSIPDYNKKRRLGIMATGRIRDRHDLVKVLKFYFGQAASTLVATTIANHKSGLQ